MKRVREVLESCAKVYYPIRDLELDVKGLAVRLALDSSHPNREALLKLIEERTLIDKRIETLVKDSFTS